MTHPHRIKAVHGGKQAYFGARGADQNEIIDLSQNLNPFMPPAGLLEEHLSRLALDTELLREYPDPEYPRLRKTVAQFLGTDAEKIALTNGASEGLLGVFRYVKDAGLIKKAVVPVPSFIDYERSLEACGILTEFAGLPMGTHEAGWLPGLAKASGTGALIVVGEPNNPDGRLYGAEDVRETARVLEASGGFLVVDEAFIDLAPAAASLVPEISEIPNLIIIRSFTKAYSIAGVRIGAVVAKETHIKAIQRSLPTWNINTLAATLLPALLPLRSELKESIALIEASKRRICSILASSDSVRVHQGEANFVLVELLGDVTSAEAQKQLADRGFLVRDCSNYRGLSERHIRFAIPRSELEERFIYAMFDAGLLKQVEARPVGEEAAVPASRETDDALSMHGAGAGAEEGGL